MRLFSQEPEIFKNAILKIEKRAQKEALDEAFKFSPFEYIKRLRTGSLNSLDPGQGGAQDSSVTSSME